VWFFEPLDRDIVRTRMPHFLVQGGAVFVERIDSVLCPRIHLLHMGGGSDGTRVAGRPPGFVECGYGLKYRRTFPRKPTRLAGVEIQAEKIDFGVQHSLCVRDPNDLEAASTAKLCEP
jgi:hypothetical protein